MKKVFCFNNCACRVFRTNLVLVWFQCCPRYFSRKKGISGTFLSLGLRPRLQKTFPRFPFFYFSTLDNTSIRRGQICPRTWQHNYRNKILYLFEPHEIYLAIFQYQTLQAKREYLAALHNQMSEREQKKDMLKQDFKEDRKIVETEREVQQNRIRQLQERKLQQLKYAFKNIKKTSFYHQFFF